MKKSSFRLIIIFLFLIYPFSGVFSQIFTEETGISLTGLYQSSANWGDYDNDNDLDLLLTGRASSGHKTLLYRNDGGIFTDVVAGLEGVSNGTATWGDYDNDADLDLLLAGTSNAGGIARIYRNDAGAFTDIYAGLIGVSGAAADWGDYDNDGDLDILISGTYNTSITKIYANENGIFTDINIGLPGVTNGSVFFTDLDNDNDLDVFLTGNSLSGYLTKTYRNENGSFFDMNALFPLFGSGASATSGDYDNDGDADIAISGYVSGFNNATKIFRNENGVFVDINAALVGVQGSCVAFGDYDNDGYLDLFVSGYPNTSKIYKNINGTFSETNIGLIGVNDGSAAWGDYDNDSKLDLVLTGYSSTGYVSKIYNNNVTAVNTAPSAPNDLSSSITASGITLTWNKSTDGQTPATALTYNVYIGTAPGAVNEKTPMSNLSTGYRKIVQKGSLQTNSCTVRRLPAGTYYWSVQAIDNELSGSAFASAGSFVIPFSATVTPVSEQSLVINQNSVPLTVTESSSAISRQWKYSTTSGGPYDKIITGATGLTCSPSFSATGIYYIVCESVKSGFSYYSNEVRIIVSDLQGSIGLSGLSNSSLSWGDYDSDGDLDLVASGYNGTTNVSSIYRNDLGVLTDIAAELPGVSNASVCWGDYDNDGDLDLLLTGSNISAIYQNNSGTFTDISAGLPGISDGFAEWMDYDNDGKLDILLGGNTTSGSITSIYRNKSDLFTDIKAGLYSSSYSFGISGDYDNDSDPDILFISSSATRIYRNDKGSFTDINAAIQTTSYPSADWGDFDNDGDLDILIAGNSYSRIFQNDNGIFTDIIANLPTLSNPTASWGDYDNDGDLDIFLAGSGFANVFRNDSGVFNQIVSSITGIYDGCAIWGDYDNDNDLDILISGKSPNNDHIMRIYKSNVSSSITNSPPSAPSNLQVVPQANSVTLTWDPAGDSSTPVKGLSYNLYIGNSPGVLNKRSPMSSIPGGFRKIVQKTSQSLSVKFNNLPAGVYYWAVQAIDNSFSGSVFSQEKSFTVAYSTAVGPSTEQTIKINQNGTVLFVAESSPANSRQWKYSTVTGGPYSNVIAGANGASYTPNFTDWGTYFIVCESVKDGIAYTSNEVRVNVPLLSEFEGSGISTINSRSVSWGDFDNDGDLDILSVFNGNRILRNDITGFQEIIPAFFSKSSYSGQWGDYDNDGDLDVLLAGSYSGIYRNDGGTFFEIPTGFSGGHYYAASAWLDYDLDGDLDVIFSGTYATKLYRNDNSFFTEINSKMIGLNSGSIDCGDYDNDGDPDILMTGVNSMSVSITAIYKNNNGVFTSIESGLPYMIAYSTARWGDYDNDGDLDIVIAGGAGNLNSGTTLGPLCKIFRNDNGVFADLNVNLLAVSNANTVWADYDNDGDLDILISGSDKSGILVTKIYRNENSVFTETNCELRGVRYGSAAWGDYDNDKDIDLLLAGTTQDGNSYFKLFTNNITFENTKPSPPSNLIVTNSGKFNFSWNRSTDSKTPTNGLSYNLYLGTLASTGNKKSPMSAIPDGFRRISSRGTEQKNSLTIKNLPAGNYFWGVQAIDHSFSGSDFSAEGTFNVPFSLVISPRNDQVINPGQSGNVLTVTESGTPLSRQWKYAVSPGGPYTAISGETASTYTPSSGHFPDLGTYYIVCQSVSGSITYTSEEVKIRIRAFAESIGSTSLYFSSSAFGDYDNDGDLDEIACGNSGSSTYTTILLKQDAGVITAIDPGMIPVNNGSVDLGDFDNDGDLDLLLTGNSQMGRISKIYRNDALTFTFVADLFGISTGSGSWGDYDNDGDLDILLSGDGFADIYRNDGGIFSQINAGFPAVSGSSSSWSDYDNDGDIDVLLTGLSGSIVISEIFRNDNGNFTDINAGLTGVMLGAHAWGDFDSDGDPDLLISGLPSNSTSVSPVTSVYRNNGGIFTDINAGLPGVFRGSVAWGDYDIDGDLDILLTGTRLVDPVSKVFRNDNGTFKDTNEEIAGVQYGTALWYDADNDTDLDIAIKGLGTGGRYGAIYKNLLVNTTASVVTANLPPASPANLTANLSANKVTFTWDKGNDTKTIQNGLTYNIYIGTTAGSVNMKSPMSALATGYRRILKAGSGINSTYIKNLPAGTYYWSVQAIDNCFAGSAFAPEGSFTIAYANSINPVADQVIAVNQSGTTLNISETTPADSRQWKYSHVSGGPYNDIIQGATGTTFIPGFSTWGNYYVVCVSIKNGVSYTSNEVRITVPLFMEDTGSAFQGAYLSLAKWGDYDNDGDLDILLAGNTASGYMSKIYRKDAEAYTNITAPLPLFGQGAGAWGDYDGDGDLDVALSGYTSAGYISKIFRNDAGVFSDINAVLQGATFSSLSWGDYDNDGDLDILLTGYVNNTTFISKIYRNDKSVFKDIHAPLEPINRGFAEWGDYDNDGDLDILLSGQGIGNTNITKIYRNNDCQFEDLNASVLQLQRGSGAWGDYDNDGDLDFLITGSNGTDSFSKIYKNHNGTFTDIYANLPGVNGGSCGWGDYDNDGDLDILLSGTSASGLISGIYRNTDGVFTNINAGLVGVTAGTICWGDYDNDKDIDVLLTGGSVANFTKIYRNTFNAVNSAPTVPANPLTTPVDMDKVLLSWDKANDVQTIQSTLTYNVRFGTTTAGNQLIPSMSGSSGYRQVPSIGNAAFRNSGFPVENLIPGKAYYWSVQAVDQAYAGGPWSVENVFTLLQAPVAGKATAVSHTGFTANWTACSGATGYLIDISTDSTFNTIVAGYKGKDAGNATSLTLSGLSPVTTYFYRVRPYITGAVSLYVSNTVKTATYPVPPQAPTGLTASSCNDKVTLSWNAITTPYTFVRYRIYAGTTSNPLTLIDSTAAGQISETTKTISNLPHGQTYYFRITGVIQQGIEGELSDSTSVLIKTGVIPRVKTKWGKLLISYNKGDSINSFQWYNGTNPINGASRQYYLTNQPGNYHLEIVDVNGCKNISNDINIVANSLSLYPNPASGNVTLTLNCESIGKTTVRIISSSGNKVLEFQINKKDPELISEVDIHPLKSGIYSVEVLVENGEKLDTRLVVIK